MPKLKMTDAAVQKATAEPGQRIDYFDAHPRDRQRGLVLRVATSRDRDGNPRTTRTWAAMCRVLGSAKLRRFTIGDYPGIGLGEARERAAEIVGRARRDGVDPLKQKKEAARQAEIASKDTIAAVVDAYLADLEKRPKKKGGMRSPRYIEETRRNFTNHVLPRWGTLNVRDITRRDVGDLLEAVMDEGSKVKGKDGKRRALPGGGIAANRTLAAIRAMFNYAMRRGIIDATPVAMVEPPAEETARERTLTAEEIAAIWKAAPELGYPFGPYFRLALILGQRRNEIARMRWQDVDLGPEPVWILPAEATKPGRTHAVPLPASAVDILKSLPRKTCTVDGKTRPSPYVFTTEGDRPISGFSKAKPALDRAITKAREGDALAAWTIHDMRRTAATGMARLGVSEFIVGRVLNHAAEGVTGKVYNHYEYIAEKRAALEKWAQYLGNLTHPPGEMTALRPAVEAA